MEEAQKRNKSQKLEKLAFLVYWFVIVLALGWISRGLGKKIEAQSCNIPTTVDTTIEVTPTSSDNVIDCSGQDITVVNGGKIIVHSYKTSDADVNNDGGAIIKVNNLTIEAGGEITADGEGYAPGDSEPVNAQESNGYAGGSGGGYGGAGGIGNTPGGSGNVPGTPGTTAGDKESPLLLGGAGGNTAGGGEGGKGGGAIKIEASGTVEINGRISANGTDGTIAPDSQTAGGGGAGGSVWIIGDILTGNGTVEAKGGGTDATANYIGGGGGGGRVVLMALSSTSFSGTIDVSGGHGSQDGGVGTIMGPGVKPADPTVTKVYETKLDNYGHPVAGTVNREVPYQGYTQKKDLTFASDMHGDTIHLEIEVRKVTESFTGTPTHVQSGWDTSKDCTGMPTSGDFDIGSYCGYVVVNGLATSVQYKWRARVVSDKGFKSNWVDVGTNGINDPDFSISGPLDTILISAGNNQTGIVGQQLPVDPKVQAVDANGIPVPLDEGYTWQVTEGGGGLANVQTTTDANGFLTAEWTLGTVAGSNNQKLTVSKGDVNTQLVASADPGPIYGYEIDTGDIINWPTNTGFTYKVTAVDQYGNKTNSNATLTVTPVKSNDVTTPGVGTLSPSSITLTNGEVTINDATYTDQESIKIQVKDSNNRVGYSKSILFVDPNGTNCPAITIDRDQTWDASTVSGGVFDCRGLGTLTVKGGYTLTLKSYDNGDNDWGNDYGVTILADDMVIEGGGVVSGDELGYQGSRGPGHRVDGGASYGGYGIDEVQPYGSAYEPAELGSAAPSEWYGHWTYAGGGGAMKLEVGGEMRIDGTITAVGAEAADGLNHSGSTGGAIWIDTGVLSGGGVIRADGGGSNKGGSGGRIAIYYSTDNSDILNTIGTVDPHVHAWGGNGAASGTIYVEHKGVDVSHGGLLYIDNNGHDWRSAALVPDTYNFSKLILKRYGHLRILGNDTVFEVASGQVEGDNTKPRLEVEGTFKSGDSLVIDGFDLNVLGEIELGSDTSQASVQIGGTNAGGMTLYAHTWAHDVSNQYKFGDITVKGNGVLTLVSYDNGDNDWGNDYGVTVEVTNDMVIESGGMVSGDELGYQGSRGPGHRVDGGASYGGYGIDEVQPYGSAYEPAELGSAAPSEWYGHWTYAGGGGAMKLEVGGEMRIDGTITAVGAEAADGLNHSGSTGGAIWIDTGVLSGGGVIRADGGGSNKGGSGGRIAIYYSTDNSDILNTIGTVDPHVHAWGGNGAASGTIYVEHKGVDVSHGGLLYIDNNGHDWRSAALVPDTYNFSKLILKRYGHLRILGNDTVFEVASGQVEGDNTKPRLEVEGTIKSASPFTVDGFDLVVLGDIQLGDSNENSTLILGGNIGGKMSLFAHTWAHNAANGYKFKEIDIKTDSTLFLWSYDNGDTDWSNDYGITLEAVNINIEASGSLSGYALGYRGMHGPGHDWGASHGGYADGTASYGDMFEPFELGSGSGVDRIGGAGGSAIKLIVTDELRNDGEITVDGEDKCDDYDAGAGGSLWLDINVLSGSGTLTADGGRDSCGSYGYQHGAGGRIAIYYYTDDSDILSTLGTDNPKVHAWAGQGYGGNSGTGPGTIYIEHKGVDPHHGGSLYIDNNGNTGRAQDLEPREYTFHNVYIGSGTYMKIKSDINAVPQGEEHPVTGRGPVLNITGDFTLASGAVLDGTGEGFPAGLGYGAGQNGIGNGGGAGGSHGGKGGRGQDDGVNGEADSGDTYGHQLQPFTIGSGGGNGGTGNLGGAGGSAIAIIALGKYNPTTNEYDYGNVTIHGTIRVNGADGRIGSPGGGGGAGGSILIEANSCAIDGVLEARGGRGGESDYDGGGGGGGRISPLYAKGPCVVENGTFDVSGGEPVNPSAYHAQAGQVGTMPPAPNTIPIPPRDKRQYAVYGTNSVEIPLGAVITTTSVELEADVYDVGATSTNPKHLKLQFELKKVGEAFDGSTGIYDSNVITFTGGDPARLRVNISNLDFGQSYKWRVRAVNADNGIVTPWVEYGDNGDTADFTISTVKSLSLEANKLTVDLDEPISLTVKALNAVGSVDDSYRGQVHFSSTASNVTLPADYTFVSEDNGEHVFTNSLVFHEVGTFTVKVEDAVNPTLYDTVDITVRPPASPFVSIGADKVQVQPGDPVELIWLTGYVTNPRIDPDIGAVDPSGHTTVVFNQVGQYTYTITGDTYDGGQLTSSVTIFVGEQQATGTVYVTQPVYITQTVTVTVPVTVTITPSITSVPSATTTPTTVYVKPGEGNQESRVCPIIKSFGANKTKVTKDEKVKLSWNVENAKQVSINILGKDLPLTGNSEVLLERTTTVRLTAVRGDCTREQTIIVKVVDKHCDYIGWLLLVALLVWDALSIPLGGLAGNIWLVVFLLVNKLLKNKRIRGSVLDIDSKEPLSGIIVELWEVNKNKLVDVEITDANGSFQFAVGNGDYVLKVANKDYVFPPASKKLEGLEGIYGNVYVGEVIKPQAGQQIDMLVEVKDKDAMYRYRGFGDYLAEVNVKWFTWPVIVSLVLYGIGLLYSVYVLIMWPLVCNGVLLLAWILIGVVKVIGLVKKPRYIQKAQYLQYMLGKQL